MKGYIASPCTGQTLYPGWIGDSSCPCALGGAYLAALATYGLTPVLAGGSQCLLARNVQPGKAHASALLVEIHGCPMKKRSTFPAVVKGSAATGPVILVNQAGHMSSNPSMGYDLFLEAVIEQLLVQLPVATKRVNLLGIIPYQHLFWKGNLQVIKMLLEHVGLEVNTVFMEDPGVDAFRKIPVGRLNLVFSPWSGVRSAARLEEKFGTPYLVFPSVPVGPKDTSSFLRIVAKRLKLQKEKVDACIKEQEERTARCIDHMAAIIRALPHAGVGIVADTGTAIGLHRHVSNEVGWIPQVIVINDNPPEEYRDAIIRHLTLGLESPVKPEVYFESFPDKIENLLRRQRLHLLLATSQEKHLALFKLEAIHLTVALPAHDRLIAERCYAGYGGGLALLEDVADKYGGSRGQHGIVRPVQIT